MSGEVASLSEELLRLAQAVQQHPAAAGQDDDPGEAAMPNAAGPDQATAAAGHALGSDPQGDGAAQSADTHPLACRYCPLCQLVALVRGDRASIGEIVRALSWLLNALVEFVDADRGEPARSATAGAADRQAEPSDDDEPPAPSRVQRITLA